MISTALFLILVLTAAVVLGTVVFLWREHLLTRKKALALLLSGVLIGSGVVIMDRPPGSSSALFPASGAEDLGIGTQPWTDETNIYSDNAAYASTTGHASLLKYSEFLHAYNFGFSSVIGASDTINGIVVVVDRKASHASQVKDYQLYLTNSANATVGTNNADTSTWYPTSDATRTYPTNSSTTYKWYANLTTADVRSSNFGVRLSCYLTANDEDPRYAYVDYIKVTVYYTASAPGFDSPSPANESTGNLLLCKTNVTLSASSACTVCFWENSTNPGTWTKAQQNNSVATGTIVRDMSAAYVTNYSTWYWWKVTAYDGVTNSSVIYKFQTYVDTEPPVVYINFSGNRSDSGSPYWLNAETTALTGIDSKGYYVNASYQHEDWMLINISTSTTTYAPIKGPVYLHWYNMTTNTWYNTTGFTKKGGGFYEYNTSVNITNISSGHKYSFDVYAYDTANNLRKISWNKTDIGGDTIRRSVYLKNNPVDITYKPLYFYNVTYAIGDRAKNDRLRHDQGADGTDYDTGYLLGTLPTDDMQQRNCIIFTGFFYDNDTCVSPFTLANIYFHTWNSADDNEYDFIWGNTSEYLGQNDIDTVAVGTANRSNITWHSLDYKLKTMLMSTTSTDFTDNLIYEFYVKISTASLHPYIISNRSIMSFILLNVPSNATLNATGDGDSDDDGLSDWNELYVSYTNPFIDDTDNDGVTDHGESHSGSDPNDYTNTTEWEGETYYYDIIRNYGVDYFVWLGVNTTASVVKTELTNFNEATEYIAIWNTSWTTWNPTWGLWDTYNGTDSDAGWTVHTFDVIKTYLDDAVGNQTINMTGNSNWNYTVSRAYSLQNLTKNKGYNFTAYNRVAATTLSAINTTAIGLTSGDFCSRWNRTTWKFDIWISGFSTINYAVNRWDVVQTKVGNTETWNT